MDIATIENHDTVLGAPRDWDHEKQGVCHGLPVRMLQTEHGPYMVSAWKPSPEELALLNAGHTIKLWVHGNNGEGHPVVAMSVGPVE